MDYCSFEGAVALRDKIARNGGPRNLVVYRAANDKYGHTVYGLKPGRDDCGSHTCPDRGTHNAEALAACSRALEKHPGISLERVLLGGKTPQVLAARLECIRMCDALNVFPSQRKMATFFRQNVRTIQRTVAA